MDPESEDNRCRVCLRESAADSYELFSGETPIYHRFEFATGYQLTYSKNLPSKICVKCLSELDIAYEFRKKCDASELTLQHCIKIENIKEEPQNNITDEIANNEPDDSIDDEFDYFDNNYNNKPKKTLKVTKKKKSNKTSKSKASDTSPKEKENDNEISNDDNSDIRKKKKTHMCATCGKTFLFQGNLKAHERIHTGDKPFKCTTCNHRFAQSGHLLVHERIHSGVKPYQCEICAKRFTVSHSLKKHMRTHTGEKPYTCIICSKCFSTSYHLSNHSKTHSDEQVYKCDWPGCVTRVFSKRDMNVHKLEHGTPKPTNLVVKKDLTYGALNYVKTIV